MKTDLAERVRREGNPLIDGTKVTWVWRGARAAQLIGDFTFWELGRALEMKQAAPRVWTASLDFPRDAYIEYAFVRNGEHVE